MLQMRIMVLPRPSRSIQMAMHLVHDLYAQQCIWKLTFDQIRVRIHPRRESGAIVRIGNLYPVNPGIEEIQIGVDILPYQVGLDQGDVQILHGRQAGLHHIR